jgi:lipoprotein-anchoring transpeptidase ErfK/SrfK
MSRRRLIVRAAAAGLGLSLAVVGGAVLLGDDPTPAGPPVAASPAGAIPASQLTPKRPAAKPLDSRAVVVAAPKGVQVYAAPNGAPKLRLGGRTDLGAEQTMLATGSRGDWWEVALPVRPNGNTGWIRRADVQARTISTRIEIDLDRHTLALLRDGKVQRRFPVAVGTKATPTPPGRFYVTDNLSTGNPSGAYGPYALGLSGHSDVLLQFGGGDGVLGIHGTNEPGSIGTDASHGCIRMRNADITALRAAVPLGAPVVVRA